MSMKEVYLTEFRKQWKAMLEKQFQGNLDELRKANMRETAERMFANAAARAACKMMDVGVDDIEKVLVEIRDEICNKGGQTC